MHCGDQRHAGLCLGRRPCTSRRRVQGRSQGTTLSASDLHNAWATILNPFYNIEYKIIKKIRQNTAWIEADILGKNLTPNRCNALAPAIVYVSNDVTIPFKTKWSYSPETTNLGQIPWFLEPCDLAIWRMTLKNNRASLLCYFKLYA